jgi:hypothetical protein
LGAQTLASFPGIFLTLVAMYIITLLLTLAMTRKMNYLTDYIDHVSGFNHKAVSCKDTSGRLADNFNTIRHSSSSILHNSIAQHISIPRVRKIYHDELENLKSAYHIRSPFRVAIYYNAL